MALQTVRFICMFCLQPQVYCNGGGLNMYTQYRCGNCNVDIMVMNPYAAMLHYPIHEIFVGNIHASYEQYLHEAANKRDRECWNERHARNVPWTHFILEVGCGISTKAAVGAYLIQSSPVQESL